MAAHGASAFRGPIGTRQLGSAIARAPRASRQHYDEEACRRTVGRTLRSRCILVAGPLGTPAAWLVLAVGHSWCRAAIDAASGAEAAACTPCPTISVHTMTLSNVRKMKFNVY